MNQMKNTDENPIVVPIHFGNATKHEISGNSLLALLGTYRDIIKELGLEVEIHLTTPEDGGWKTALLFWIVGLLSPVIVPLVTGYTSDELGKIGHEKIIEMINEFLTKQSVELPLCIPNEYLKSKNKMYKQFQLDPCIEYLEIGQNPKINKQNFNEYISDINDEIEELKCIYLGEKNIIVSSPDWKNKRSWTGTLDNLELSFKFDLDLTGKLWEKIKLDELTPHTGTDNMLVQVAVCENTRPKHLVIRVISYNDIEIDKSLTTEELSKILPPTDRAPDLFSDIQ